MKMMKEPFHRYGITDDGEVFSLIKREPLKMKGTKDSYGYKVVSLRGYPCFTKQRFYVHRLVFEYFGKGFKPDLVVRHMDGSTTNNNISNLAIGTTLQNNRDKQRHGTQCMGITHGNHKLKEADVLQIRRENSTPIKELMKRYDISKATVDKIRSRDSWKHI